MINNSELRIGNYVTVEYPTNVHGIYMIKGITPIINGYHERSTITAAYNPNWSLEVMTFLLEPIKLNRELLEKAGFIYSSNHIYEHADYQDILFDEPDNLENAGKYPIGISGLETLFPSYCVSHGEVVIRCLYLHTLQNMFHAITQKELNIDFKK